MSELAPAEGSDILAQVQSLESLLRTGDLVSIHQTLRHLQEARVPQSDQRVLVERVRARNEATNFDPEIEENALLALEMIEGFGPLGLDWSPAARLPALLRKVVDIEDLRSGLTTAFAPTDLLPPRPVPDIDPGRADQGIAAVVASLDEENVGWESDVFLVPKSAFTSRPMSLLPLQARIWYEALAQQLVQPLEGVLPAQALWPRNEESSDREIAFRRRPLGWQSSYIAKADIANFYASIDHELLGASCRRLGMTLTYVETIECFLAATTRRRVGLPQGPRASDVFASAVLAEIDSELAESGQVYLRFADDYFFPASSVTEGRVVLERLEELLADRGLSLSDQKTTVMRRTTYAANESATRRAARRLRDMYLRDLVAALEASDDRGFVEDVLERAGVEEEVLWDLLYHHTISLREVINQARDQFSPSDRMIYQQLLVRAARDLERPRQGDISAISSLAGEAILALAAAGGTVDDDVIVRLLDWFPSLSRHVSSYLSSLSDEYHNYISATIETLLAMEELGDWERAWIIQPLVENPGLVSASLRERLQVLVDVQGSGLLSRLSASRALGLFDQREHPSLTSLWRDASPAIRSEMVFLSSGDALPALGSSPELEGLGW